MTGEEGVEVLSTFLSVTEARPARSEVRNTGLVGSLMTTGVYVGGPEASSRLAVESPLVVAEVEQSGNAKVVSVEERSRVRAGGEGGGGGRCLGGLGGRGALTLMGGGGSILRRESSRAAATADGTAAADAFSDAVGESAGLGAGIGRAGLDCVLPLSRIGLGGGGGGACTLGDRGGGGGGGGTLFVLLAGDGGSTLISDISRGKTRRRAPSTARVVSPVLCVVYIGTLTAICG